MTMPSVTLLNAVTATTTGQSFKVNELSASAVAPTAQFVITNVATVVLQGSVNNENWTDIISVTASCYHEDVPKFPYYRGNPTITSGSVTLLLGN